MANGGEVDIEKQKLKYAMQDIKLLEKSGYMGITDTKYGVLFGEFKNGIYSFAKNDGTNLFSGNRQDALNFVKNAYTVESAADGGVIYDTNKVTTIIISNKAPLSTALETITGKSWNTGDFEGNAAKGEIFTEKSTGRKFTTLNVAEAKAEGAKGIHVPSEGTIHEFYESIEKNGLHTTVGIYLKENYLMPDTIDSLIGGYATSKTDRNGINTSVKEESELLKRITRYSFKHATEI